VSPVHVGTQQKFRDEIRDSIMKISQNAQRGKWWARAKRKKKRLAKKMKNILSRTSLESLKNLPILATAQRSVTGFTHFPMENCF
jgi:hypothetical protein